MDRLSRGWRGTAACCRSTSPSEQERTGCRRLCPRQRASSPLTGITFNGTAIGYSLQTIKGVQYAIFAAGAGSYQVSYGPDITPPTISALATSVVGTSSANITWTTNEPADSVVHFGTDPASLTLTTSNSSLVTSHNVGLTGLTSGTTYYYRVTSTDAAGNPAIAPTTDPPPSFTTTAPPVITSASTASGTVGVAFAYQITATNAPGSYGATGLPAGLSVNSGTGLISGTPTAAGTSTVTLSATNGAGSGTGTLTLTVAPAAPVITSATTASGAVSVAFTYQITATNAPTSYGATGLPAGLSVNSATGLISGTPTAAGTSTVSLSATNGGGSGTATLTLTIAAGPPVITSAGTASGTAGSAFTYQITATNAPTSYGATGLPAGLSINTGTGLISGTPTAAGTSTVTLSATNSAGSGTATLTLTVAPAPPVVTSATTASGTVGVPFTYQITATNTPTSYGASGLPAGLAVNTGTGLISGTPTAAGTSTVTVSATNSAGSGNATLTLTIAPAPPVITSATTAGGTAGTPFTYQITATNTPTSYGATGLPAGLSVNAGTGPHFGDADRRRHLHGNDTGDQRWRHGNGDADTDHRARSAGDHERRHSERDGWRGVLLSDHGDECAHQFRGDGVAGRPAVNTGTGLISGTPTAAGTSTVTLSATNGAGSGTATLTLTIAPAPSGIIIDATVSNARSTNATTIAAAVIDDGRQRIAAGTDRDGPRFGNTTTITNVAATGLTWQLVRRTNGQKGTAEIWRAFATTTLNNVTVTATISQSVAASITVMSFKGVDTSGTNGSGAIGNTGSGSAVNGAPSATLTTTARTPLSSALETTGTMPSPGHLDRTRPWSSSTSRPAAIRSGCNGRQTRYRRAVPV